MDPRIAWKTWMSVLPRGTLKVPLTLDKLNHYLEDKPSPPPVKELRARVDERVRH